MFVDVGGFEVEALCEVSGFPPCSCDVVCASDAETGTLYVFVGFENLLNDRWIELWLPNADVRKFL